MHVSTHDCLTLIAELHVRFLSGHLPSVSAHLAGGAIIIDRRTAGELQMKPIPTKTAQAITDFKTC